MRNVLVNYHGQILCSAEGNSYFKKFSICTDADEFELFQGYVSDGRKYFINGIEYYINKLSNEHLSFKKGNKFLGCLKNGKMKLSSDEAKEWERFALINLELLKNIHNARSFAWINGDNKKVINKKL